MSSLQPPVSQDTTLTRITVANDNGDVYAGGATEGLSLEARLGELQANPHVTTSGEFVAFETLDGDLLRFVWKDRTRELTFLLTRDARTSQTEIPVVRGVGRGGVLQSLSSRVSAAALGNIYQGTVLKSDQSVPRPARATISSDGTIIASAFIDDAMEEEELMGKVELDIGNAVGVRGAYDGRLLVEAESTRWIEVVVYLGKRWMSGAEHDYDLALVKLNAIMAAWQSIFDATATMNPSATVVLKEVLYTAANETDPWGLKPASTRAWLNDAPARLTPLITTTSWDVVIVMNDYTNSTNSTDFGFGGALGVAWVGMVCDARTHMRYSVNTSPFNFSTNWWATFIGHEVGHNLGFLHDYKMIRTPGRLGAMTPELWSLVCPLFAVRCVILKDLVAILIFGTRHALSMAMEYCLAMGVRAI